MPNREIILIDSLYGGASLILTNFSLLRYNVIRIFDVLLCEGYKRAFACLYTSAASGGSSVHEWFMSAVP